jgi:hypothetical protein
LFTGEKGLEGLAVYEKRKVDAPYAGCEDYNNLFPVPDSDVGLESSR